MDSRLLAVIDRLSEDIANLEKALTGTQRVNRGRMLRELQVFQTKTWRSCWPSLSTTCADPHGFVHVLLRGTGSRYSVDHSCERNWGKT